MDTEIEVFLADTGASRGITAANIAEVASFDCAKNPVPICFGHPKSDDPAAGTVSAFRSEGSRLFAKVGNLTKKAIDGIKSGEWINRSMAFFDPAHEANPTPGKWAPRHLGLLGGSAPGIPGMANLQRAFSFDADGGLVADAPAAPAVIYAPAPTTTFTIHDEPKEPKVELTAEQIAENERLKKEREQFEADKVAFAASQKTAFEAGNASIVDSLVTAGKVLPADAAKLKVVFNALSADELTFDADGKDKGTGASALAAIFTAQPKRVPVNEERKSPTGEFKARSGGEMTSAQITAAARELQSKDKSLTFEAAVEQVREEAAA